MDLRLFNHGRTRKGQNVRDAGEPIGRMDVMGILDPGFEQSGLKDDFEVAPGLMAHFDTLDDPPPDYYSMPVLESGRSLRLRA